LFSRRKDGEEHKGGEILRMLGFEGYGGITTDIRQGRHNNGGTAGEGAGRTFVEVQQVHYYLKMMLI